MFSSVGGTRYGAPSLDCPLCGSGMLFGHSCSHCFLPAEVVETVLHRKQAPQFVAVLGPSGVGKTVFLGVLLELLSRGAQDFQGLARGNHSLKLQSQCMTALERQRFPEKTPTEPDRWNWVCADIAAPTSRGRTRPLDLVTPDVAGESVVGELDAPRTVPTIRALLARCAGLVILADAVKLVSDGQQEELHAMQLINYLVHLRGGGSNRPIDVPVAVVFTKVDYFDEPVENYEAFVQSNAAGLWKLARTRLKHIRFSGSGVAGACGLLLDTEGNQSIIPLRFQPFGILEPFSWLTAQMA